MIKIWANRLIAGTQTWDKCIKTGRSETVRKELQDRVNAGLITIEQYQKITGEIVK